MATLLSPGVAVSTNDLSQVTTATGDSAACFSGDFVQGPVNVPTLITSVAELKATFGGPTKSNYNQWYQCYNFLQYSSELYITRAADINGTPAKVNVPYNSNEFVNVPKEETIPANIIKHDTATANVVSMAKSEDLNAIEVGDTLRFGTDPLTFVVESIVEETVSKPNPAYVGLTDLEVTIAEDTFTAGDTITYTATTDGVLNVTADVADAVEINQANSTIKFLKSGDVNITFSAVKDALRAKKLQGTFSVAKAKSAKLVAAAGNASNVAQGADITLSFDNAVGTLVVTQNDETYASAVVEGTNVKVTAKNAGAGSFTFSVTQTEADKIESDPLEITITVS